MTTVVLIHSDKQDHKFFQIETKCVFEMSEYIFYVSN